ncbi:general secretion pathway protein A [Lysobacter niastensis]|uniref:General secretion pathway protein A n=1 Tax=Lysobacter niastensis TaxID=380629 RepID=A0ABU1WAZ9_9GAMM|nr:AAA family ATPase [Lysobacter niastensis]MDR7134738.1 general secretion pathway protein A [Lysobacter niastensis]
MYLEHYGLQQPPFSITPDPRFVFLSERHRDALAHLLFGIGQGGGGGFVQLTGEVGTGKTTLCRLLMEQVPENTRVALVLNPRLSPVELLETICEELHLDLDGARGSVKALVDRLNAYLLDAYAQGLCVVLIIDEAQNLSVEALEQVRLLTNLETPTQKLLQILLLGQPELREMLAREDMRQLAQRITARYHLTPLDAAETGEYLRHRYRVAGGQRFPFSSAAVRRIHAHSGGVPRLVNVIAERALLAGYAHDETSIDARWVDRAAREALAPPRPRDLTVWRVATAVVAVVALTAAAWTWWPRPPSPSPDTSAQAMPKTAQPVNTATAVKPAAKVVRLDEDGLLARLGAAEPSPLPAWRQLLAMWRLPATDADAVAASACPAALAPGVYCVRGQARLDKLATQGRPALLRLQSGGKEHWALLQGADAVTVRLSLDGVSVDTSRVALEHLWTGDYAAVWRGPAYFDAPLAMGAQGPAIGWIGKRLTPGYEPAQRPSATLDDAMIEAVRRFQRARGLDTDGVVGPETLLALSAGEMGPRLQRVLE